MVMTSYASTRALTLISPIFSVVLVFLVVSGLNMVVGYSFWSRVVVVVVKSIVDPFSLSGMYDGSSGPVHEAAVNTMMSVSNVPVHLIGHDFREICSPDARMFTIVSMTSSPHTAVTHRASSTGSTTLRPLTALWPWPHNHRCSVDAISGRCASSSSPDMGEGFGQLKFEFNIITKDKELCCRTARPHVYRLLVRCLRGYNSFFLNWPIKNKNKKTKPTFFTKNVFFTLKCVSLRLNSTAKKVGLDLFFSSDCITVKNNFFLTLYLNILSFINCVIKLLVLMNTEILSSSKENSVTRGQVNQ